MHGPENVLMSLVQKFGLATERIFTWAHGDGGPGPDHPVNGGIGLWRRVREKACVTCTQTLRCVGGVWWWWGAAYYWYGRTKEWYRFDDPELKAVHEALWDIESLDPKLYKPTDTLTDYLRSAFPPAASASALLVLNR